MARRATAVSLACLLATGLAPPHRGEAAPLPARTPGPGAVAAVTWAGPPHTPWPGTSDAALVGSPDVAWTGAPYATLVGASDTSDPAARCAPEAAGRVRDRGPEPRQPQPQDVGRVLAELGKGLAGGRAPGRVVVPVWVHVLTDGVTRAATAAVKAQFATLRDAYAGKFGGVDTGVTFRLAGARLVRNAEWFADPTTNETAMKQALRKGGPETLNLYIAQLDRQVLGFSTYPYWYKENPQIDGVVVDWRTLPGGSFTGYDRGYTAVHEIGHWLGLFHTFENGCANPGDGIDDTPPEASPTEGCPESKDTCTPDGQPDPVHNFMDYARDACMREFTAGQAARMREMWVVYRTPAPTQAAARTEEGGRLAARSRHT
ncbi:zinc metalloprotease [Nonomuraea sp. NPDC050691]|uniref:zinc metalloprotease n=1 Tax=Nonomuraea sp. NPDC050691 TaxID=3155661 RepID=UPI00340DCC90